MRIMITGGCGFIGSNFINRYFNHFDFLLNIDIIDYCSSINNVNEDIRKNKKY